MCWDADLSLYTQEPTTPPSGVSYRRRSSEGGRGERRAARSSVDLPSRKRGPFRPRPKQDYGAFYQNELRMRSLGASGTFADLFTLTVSALMSCASFALPAAMCGRTALRLLQPTAERLGGRSALPRGRRRSRRSTTAIASCVYLMRHRRQRAAAHRQRISAGIYFTPRKKTSGLDIFCRLQCFTIEKRWMKLWLFARSTKWATHACKESAAL